MFPDLMFPMLHFPTMMFPGMGTAEVIGGEGGDWEMHTSRSLLFEMDI